MSLENINIYGGGHPMYSALTNTPQNAKAETEYGTVVNFSNSENVQQNNDTFENNVSLKDKLLDSVAASKVEKCVIPEAGPLEDALIPVIAGDKEKEKIHADKVIYNIIQRQLKSEIDKMSPEEKMAAADKYLELESALVEQLNEDILKADTVDEYFDAFNKFEKERDEMLANNHDYAIGHKMLDTGRNTIDKIGELFRIDQPCDDDEQSQKDKKNYDKMTSDYIKQNPHYDYLETKFTELHENKYNLTQEHFYELMEEKYPGYERPLDDSAPNRFGIDSIPGADSAPNRFEIDSIPGVDL